MNTYDFIIIGGGIAGASAGFELAAFGKVLLLERESQFGYHSTGRSAAVLLKSQGPEVFGHWPAPAKNFPLHPPVGFADYPLLKPRGLLLIGGPDDAAMLDRAARSAGGTSRASAG